MKTRQTGLAENALIWFGAGVSIAEILTGTYFAPLGFWKGFCAILLGHLIGCILMYYTGLIGGRERKSAMETVKRSFGQKGGLLFALLNIIQLLGWTAIMIYDGALAAASVFAIPHGLICLIIGGLILLWIAIGLKNLGKLNAFAMTALFLLTVVLCIVIVNSTETAVPIGETLSFGAALELSVAMPLSWLPLISDYTREAEKPQKATLTAVVTYGAVSVWMYTIGMSAALFTAESDVAAIMVKAGLGIAGLLIIVLSTVTTSFLDAYSAGVSAESLFKKINGKIVSLIVAVVGTAAAILFPMDDITDFLYFIGSVFAPMASILICDYFILKEDHSGVSFHLTDLTIWVCGFVVYQLLMRISCPLGSTVPAMLVTALLSLIAAKIGAKKTNTSS